jgi:hypothetical protein
VLETGVGLATTGAGLWVASVVLLAGLVAWLGTLAAGLLARALTA